MLSFHHEISPENLFTTITIKNTHSYPGNDISPIKWWACGQPVDLPKHLGLIFLKISEGRSNASLVLVITLRSPVHSICKSQLMCLLVEERQLRGSCLSLEESAPTFGSLFCIREKIPIHRHYHIPMNITFFLLISNLFYHCIQENNYLGKNFHLQSHYRKE